ncbi:MAG: hypothetical protein JSW20_06845 [Nitrospiraceae bacterium]|nr:MAG: hypothetical protein JSW20_06845 [Nitrospiraceae bacterium]
MKISKDNIRSEIMSYLTEHPEARDTLDGIVQWWLLECRIIHQTAVVKEALADLVSQGLIIKHTKDDSQILYSLNRSEH